MSPHSRLVDHLAAGILDAEDRAHAARCTACAALLGGEAARPRPEDPRPELADAVRRELGRPVRPWWLWPLLLALGNAALAVGAVAVLEPWNWEVSESPRWLLAAAAACLAALGTLGIWLASAPPSPRFQGALLLALAAPLAVLVASDGRVANDRFLDGATCLWTTLALSALPLVAAAFLLTRNAPSALRAGTMGLAAAAVALLVLQFHCADGDRAHLFVFHLLPWGALGALLAVVRRRLPTWSYAP